MVRKGYYECLKEAEQINGIVYKSSRQDFHVAKSLWSLACKVINQQSDVCFYEVVSNRQCTYVDLDLKTKDCMSLPHRVKQDPWNMVRQFLELLESGFKNHLKATFKLDDVTIGDSCGTEKVSFHVMVYDGKSCWETGFSKQPPHTSSQRHFIQMLRAETLRSPDVQDCLVFIRKSGEVDSVIDTNPYNSKGNQSFRTLLSKKIGL